MRPQLALFLAVLLVIFAVARLVLADAIPADRLRQLAERLHDPAGAKRHIPGSTVTLSVKDVPVWDALREIEKQTGNTAIDWERERGGGGKANDVPRVSCEFKNESYWSAIDQLLDQARLDVEGQSGRDGLAIIKRGRGNSPRAGRAAYCGAFRIEAMDVQSQRNLRRPRDASLMLQLQVAWEPRLRPIAITQAAADLEARVDEIAPLAPQEPAAVFSAEVPLGAQAVDLVLPFELPPRSTPKISSLRGKLRAIVPGRQAKFEFDDLANAAGKSQRVDDVEVTIDDMRKNNEIWELQMRLKLAGRNRALESHRGWAFDNRSYLVDANGEVIENVGLETVSESKREIGVAYFFDLPDGPQGLKWVYETPADIAETEVDYELRDIELP